MKWAIVEVKATGLGLAYVPVPDSLPESELVEFAWKAVQHVSSWGNLNIEPDTHECAGVSLAERAPNNMNAWGDSLGVYDHNFVEGMGSENLAALADDPTAPDFVRRQAHLELVRRGERKPKETTWNVTGFALFADGTWVKFEHQVSVNSALDAKKLVRERHYAGSEVARVLRDIPTLV